MGTRPAKLAIRGDRDAGKAEPAPRAVTPTCKPLNLSGRVARVGFSGSATSVATSSPPANPILAYPVFGSLCYPF